MPPIVLTTDFGLTDPFVGLMKGAILSIAPAATIVDLCHHVPPQDIAYGAVVLESALGVFPPQAIHVAVVDPGVGSERDAVAVRTDAGVYVAPDNGLLTLVVRGRRFEAVRLTRSQFHRPAVSATFHGRDVFAPVAAHLAAGTPLQDLGDPIGELKSIAIPEPEPRGDVLVLHVIAVDHFGNLITDLTASAYDAWRGDRGDDAVQVRVGSTTIRGVRRTFSDVEPGQPLAYLGSLGRLEIAVRNGSAAASLGVGRGDTFTLT